MKGQSRGLHGIKVLHVITVFSVGGATENTLLSVQGLQDLGYDVRILTGPHIPSEGSMFDQARQFNVRVEVIETLTRSIYPISDLKAFLSLIRFLRRGRFDVVHTHSSKAGFLGRLASRIAGVPIVVHTIHGLPFHEYQGRFIHLVFVIAERIGASLSDKLVSVTHTIVRKALHAKVGSAEKYAVVRSGFDAGEFLAHQADAESVRKSFGIGPDALVVGKIARFTPLKGHRYLVDAIHRVVENVPGVRFLLVGSGEIEEEIRRHVKERGLSEYVVFTGRVEVERIPSFISAMDIVVHTSMLEGLARVLPQALALRKPVVSFNIDGAHEVVIDGQTGHLIEPFDCMALADGIIDLAKDKEKRERFGRTGEEMIKQEWSKSAMVNGINQCYEALLKRKGLL